MDDARFEESMSRMEGEIESLDIPESEKAKLRRLAQETRTRREAIKDAGTRGQEAAERLGESLASMRSRLQGILDTLTKVKAAAEDARLAAKMAQFDREARERELRGEGLDHREIDDGEGHDDEG